jgi:hypothetical protein
MYSDSDLGAIACLTHEQRWVLPLIIMALRRLQKAPFACTALCPAGSACPHIAGACPRQCMGCPARIPKAAAFPAPAAGQYTAFNQQYPLRQPLGSDNPAP